MGPKPDEQRFSEAGGSGVLPMEEETEQADTDMEQ